MAWIKLANTSSGAPALTATNGSLTAVLRWALPQLGWAIEYGPTGNAAVFRAAVGNRHRFCINNNAGANATALVRGALGATSATAWTNVFPTTTQQSNGNSVWPCGYQPDPSVQVPYVIYGNDRFFYFIQLGGYTSTDTGSAFLNFFGDVPSDYSTGWETVISMLGSGGVPSNILLNPVYSYQQPSDGIYWARRIDGVTLSTQGNLLGWQQSIGNVLGTPLTRAGYLNRLYRSKMAVSCGGTATATPGSLGIMQRGWLPNFWSPVASGNTTMAVGDTFTDSVYNPSASFIWYGYSNNAYGFIIEETDTWSKP